METTFKSKLMHYLKTTGILFMGGYIIVGLTMQASSVAWTGTTQPADIPIQTKVFWDWVNLAVIPLILVGGILLLHRSKRDSDRQRTEQQTALKREIVQDGQHEAAFQAYVDRMSELLLKEKLSKFSPEEVRNVARIRTLTVLRGLDGKRKGTVVLFLKDSGLIDREAVIDLSGADLSGARLEFSNLSRLNLSEANLSRADLRGTNLSKSYLGAAFLSEADLEGANLRGADLFDANLSGADLRQTKLSKANLNGADLRGCHLNEADLSDANLSGVNLNVGDLVGANLRGAKLDGAKLLGADLREADLSQADLSGTEVTEVELEKAKSLVGTTMPDGTKHN